MVRKYGKMSDNIHMNYLNYYPFSSCSQIFSLNTIWTHLLSKNSFTLGLCLNFRLWNYFCLTLVWMSLLSAVNKELWQ